MYKKTLFILVIAIVISVILISINENQFDEANWKNNPLTRYTMAKDIVENELLIGESKSDIILRLGEAKTSNLEGKDHLIYPLGKAPSFFESKDESLIIIFDNDSVSKVIHSK